MVVSHNVWVEGTQPGSLQQMLLTTKTISLASKSSLCWEGTQQDTKVENRKRHIQLLHGIQGHIIKLLQCSHIIWKVIPYTGVRNVSECLNT